MITLALFIFSSPFPLLLTSASSLPLNPDNFTKKGRENYAQMGTGSAIQQYKSPFLTFLLTNHFD